LPISPNPFFQALERGEAINEVLLEKSDTEDDDWITFRFKSDPAVRPFTHPKRQDKPHGTKEAFNEILLRRVRWRSGYI